MKKLRANIAQWLDRLEKSWELLPVENQHKYILYFFTVYLLLTAWIIFKIWHETAKFHNAMTVEDIESPRLDIKECAALMKGNESTMLNSKNDERK